MRTKKIDFKDLYDWLHDEATTDELKKLQLAIDDILLDLEYPRG